MIEARQIRAARALLDWTRDDLAKASGLSVPALTQIEGEHRTARGSSMDKIRAALESAGVVFTDNMGVKMRSEMVTIYEGVEGYKAFGDDRYLTAMHGETDFLMCGGLQDDFKSVVSNDYYEQYIERMRSLPNFRMRGLKPESDLPKHYADYITYRVVPDEQFFSVPFYVYGSKLAIISWHPAPRVVVLNDKHVSSAYRQQFELLWRQARSPRRTTTEGDE